MKEILKLFFCSEHKLENMIDIFNKKCIECNDVKANPKYKNHCLRCFIFKFPDEPIIRNYKIKEQHVIDFIKENFPNQDLIFNRQIQGGCSKKLPDVFIDLFTHSIIIECDEDQHKTYLCDNKHTMELFQDLGNIYLLYLLDLIQIHILMRIIMKLLHVLIIIRFQEYQ